MDYDTWLMHDPREDHADPPEVTGKNAEEMAECAVNWMPARVLVRRLTEYYLENPAQYREDWSDYNHTDTEC